MSIQIRTFQVEGKIQADPLAVGEASEIVEDCMYGGGEITWEQGLWVLVKIWNNVIYLLKLVGLASVRLLEP